MFLNPFPVTHPIHDDRERIKEPVAAGKTKGMKDLDYEFNEVRL